MTGVGARCLPVRVRTQTGIVPTGAKRLSFKEKEKDKVMFNRSKYTNKISPPPPGIP